MAGDRVGETILIVCGANVCRSPFLAHVLHIHLAQLVGADHGGITVTSAGTHALVGSPPDERTRTTAARYGGSLAEHRARQLHPSDMEAATLVLTAERAHRAEAATLYPRALSRTFTLLELQRLIRDVDPSDLGDHPAKRLQQLVPYAHSRRGMQPPGARRQRRSGGSVRSTVRGVPQVH